MLLLIIFSFLDTALPDLCSKLHCNAISILRADATVKTRKHFRVSVWQLIGRQKMNNTCPCNFFSYVHRSHLALYLSNRSLKADELM